MSTLPEGDREWSWAASADAVQEHQSHARRLVGSRIIGITYIDLDYTGFNHEDRTYGPRPVVDELEWAEANWAMPMCDSVDFGIEFRSDNGQVWSVAWDPPGAIEGIGLREGTLLGVGGAADFNSALWDVTRRSRWTPLLDETVTDVELHYKPWGPTSFWCPWITLSLGDRSIDLLLAQGLREQPYLEPSPDNIVVVFPSEAGRFEPYKLWNDH
ncbi:MAG TPA: hypothetical protein VIJ34_01425 [Acidimicrobiales bacterium]